MARRLLRPRLHMARAQRVRDRAFTLIELMIFVEIVGILAVLGVVGYRKLISNSKMTEATGVVSGIRLAQEAYRTERGIYAEVGGNYCPSDGVSAQTKTQWNPACSGGVTTWDTLGVHVDAPVQFGFITRSAPSTASGYGVVDITGLNTAVPWYTVHAKADLDGSGSAAPYSEVATTSQGNQIYTKGDGN